MALRGRIARRRADLLLNRPTLALGAVGVGTFLAAVGLEVARVWRRGEAPLPAETERVFAAAEVAARQSVSVAVEGYQATSPRENALFNMLVAFSLTFGGIRTTTFLIRRRGEFGPFRNVRLGRRHIHHFVPGIVLATLAGGAGIVTRDEQVEKWLAIPFGIGVGLTLDESALLLELEDVYWTSEGVVSVQISLAVMAMIATAVLSRRLLRRGEERVLPPIAAVRRGAANGGAAVAGDGRAAAGGRAG